MNTGLILSQVDHLVYATPDLAEGLYRIERLLGVRPAPGGQHPGWGTRNALLALGPGNYLEVIGPDPDQPRPLEGRLFGIDTLDSARLVTWAAKGQDLNGLRSLALRNKVNLGEVRGGSRHLPDGSVVNWQLTDPRSIVEDGIVPFFIDWGQSPHPSATSPQGARLVTLRAEHHEAERVKRKLERLGLELAVTDGPTPKLIAVIDGAFGRIQLE
jgi:hypothetical protein